jgi:FkbM family methyltransferase
MKRVQLESGLEGFAVGSPSWLKELQFSPGRLLRLLGTPFFWRYFTKHAGMVASLMVKPAYWRWLCHGVAPAIEHEAVLAGLNAASIIDVGANRGQFAAVARRRFPHAAMFAFEPIESACRQMERLFSNAGSFAAFPFALGSAEGFATLHLSRHEPSSSLLPSSPAQAEVFPGTGEIGSRKVVVKRLDAVLGPPDLPRPTLCKIDVQGTEMEVLNGFGNLIGQVDVFIIEVSFVQFYSGQDLFSEIFLHLAQADFALDCLYGAFTDRLGNILQCNAAFRRRTACPKP